MKWTKVEDKLPKENVYVLCWVEREGFGGYYFIWARKEEDGKSTWGDTEVVIDDDERVTHWAYLPNKPS